MKVDVAPVERPERGLKLVLQASLNHRLRSLRSKGRSAD